MSASMKKFNERRSSFLFRGWIQVVKLLRFAYFSEMFFEIFKSPKSENLFKGRVIGLHTPT